MVPGKVSGSFFCFVLGSRSPSGHGINSSKCRAAFAALLKHVLVFTLQRLICTGQGGLTELCGGSKPAIWLLGIAEIWRARSICACFYLNGGVLNVGLGRYCGRSLIFKKICFSFMHEDFYILCGPKENCPCSLSAPLEALLKLGDRNQRI